MIASAGIAADYVPAGIDEIAPGSHPSRDLALENALRKARHVARQHPNAIVLGADTLVALGDEIFGKPADLDEAAAMLERLAGRTHEVVTAVCLIDGRRNAQLDFVEVTRVKFRPLDRSGIAAYLAEIDPLDKAGAYAAQEDRGRLIECIEGSFTNVIGLPMERLVAALETHFPELLGR